MNKRMTGDGLQATVGMGMKKQGKNTARRAKAKSQIPRRKILANKQDRAATKSVTQSDAQRILAAVKRIPRGHVSTYGNVAEVAGLPRRARLVGTVLRQTPASTTLPWFRVINAGGRISFPVDSDAYERQRAHLEAEGIELIRGRVDLQRYGWPSREAELDELLWKQG